VPLAVFMGSILIVWIVELMDQAEILLGAGRVARSHGTGRPSFEHRAY
jgi:hypothetical protein